MHTRSCSHAVGPCGELASSARDGPSPTTSQEGRACPAVEWATQAERRGGGPKAEAAQGGRVGFSCCCSWGHRCCCRAIPLPPLSPAPVNRTAEEPWGHSMSALTLLPGQLASLLPGLEEGVGRTGSVSHLIAAGGAPGPPALGGCLGFQFPLSAPRADS